MTRNRVAVVTGGAGAGIGRGISTALARDGWHVAILDLDPDSIHLAIGELHTTGVVCTGYEVDISDDGSVQEAIERVVKECGPPEALVNSAGRGLIRPLAEVTPGEWDALHAVDLRGAFLMTRAVLPHMIAAGGGAVVNIGSVQALGPHEGYTAYAAAKAGLVGLTKGIAADYGRDGIRCSIIHPGFVESAQNRKIVEDLGATDYNTWMQHYLNSRQMIPRVIEPADIGAAAAFLVSDRARSITAAELVIDAGSSAMAFDR